MPDYTLFIDESGDFESSKGEWIIGGILIKNNYEQIESLFNKKFQKLPAKYNLSSINDFHLTEIRKKLGHTRALEIAKEFFNDLNKICHEYVLLTIQNRYKESLSSPEKTYRAMLLDMIYLADSCINEVINKFNIIVASRTIDRTLVTTEDDIKKDVLSRMPNIFEYDLVSNGMINLLSGKKIYLKIACATKNWGLICADFISNIAYHYKEREESEFINYLENIGLYKTFKAFGSHEERRARIAERNNDYVLAIYRWLEISLNKNIERKENACREIKRIFSNIRNFNSNTEIKFSIEALIERIWRRINGYDNRLKLYEILYESIREVCGDEQKIQMFRINNMVLLLHTRNADYINSINTIKKQYDILNSIVSKPESFPLVLDFWRSECETYVNNLDFIKANELACKYEKIVDTYCEIIMIIDIYEKYLTYESNEFLIKKDLFVLRIYLLSIIYNTVPPKDLEQLSIIINKLSNVNLSKNSKSRFNYIKAMYYICNKDNNGLKCLIAELNNDKIELYDIFTCLLCYNTLLMNNKNFRINDDLEISMKSIENSIMKFNINDSFIGSNIYRELGIMKWLKYSNKSDSMKLLSKSKKILIGNDSKLNKYLSDGIEHIEISIKQNNIKFENAAFRYFL